MTRQVGVDPALDVHVIPDREPLMNRHDLRQPATQMAGHAAHELGGNLLIAQRAARHFQQPLKGPGKIPVILTVSRRHATTVYRELLLPIASHNPARVQAGCRSPPRPHRRDRQPSLTQHA